MRKEIDSGVVLVVLYGRTSSTSSAGRTGSTCRTSSATSATRATTIVDSLAARAASDIPDPTVQIVSLGKICASINFWGPLARAFYMVRRVRTHFTWLGAIFLCRG